MTNKDLLDIPEFLRRQSNDDKANITTIEPEFKAEEQPKVEVVEEVADIEKPKKPSIQDRMRKRLMYIIADIDDAFENVWARNEDPKKFKAYHYFLANDIPGAFMKMLKQHVDVYISEESKGLRYRDIKPSERTDEQQDYVESFESYSKAEMKHHIAWWERVYKDCELWEENKKKQRKPRKYKPPSKEKLVKKVKYKIKDDNVKLTSVDPVSIIGAHGLIVYNTKTRKLGIYEATHKHHGLSIKGTSVLNYDVDTSIQKTLRKPDEVLERVHTGGIQALKNILNSIKATDVKLTGRLNGETILVRVFN